MNVHYECALWSEVWKNKYFSILVSFPSILPPKLLEQRELKTHVLFRTQHGNNQ